MNQQQIRKRKSSVARSKESSASKIARINHLGYISDTFFVISASLALLFASILTRDGVRCNWIILILYSSCVYYSFKNSKTVQPIYGCITAICFWAISSFVVQPDKDYMFHGGFRWSNAVTGIIPMIIPDCFISLITSLMPVLMINLSGSIGSKVYKRMKTELLYFVMLINSVYTPSDTNTLSGYTFIILIRCIIAGISYYLTLYMTKSQNFKVTPKYGINVAINVMAVIFCTIYFIPILVVVLVCLSLLRKTFIQAQSHSTDASSA